MDDRFSSFVVPDFGALPSWMIGTLGEDNPVRKTLTEMFYGLRFLDGESSFGDKFH